MKGYFDYNTSVPVSASMRKMLAEWLDSDPAFLGSGNSPLPPAWLQSEIWSSPLMAVIPSLYLRSEVNSELNFSANFEGLVLGCIDADFCK